MVIGSLDRAIMLNRRKAKYLKIRNRLRLRYFEYEDVGKLDKAVRLIDKITCRMLQPCKRCGAI